MSGFVEYAVFFLDNSVIHVFLYATQPVNYSTGYCTTAFSAEHNRIPAEHNRIPAELNRIPAELNRIPAERNRIPTERNRIPTERNRIPAVIQHIFFALHR
jgi:hypothetical protein